MLPVVVQDKKTFVQSLPFSIVQGAANTFVQLTIPTGVNPDLGYVLVLDSVECMWQAGTLVGAAGPVNVDLALSRNSKTAIPLPSDPDLIAKSAIRYVTTALGVVQAVQTFPLFLDFQGKQIVAGPNVYLGLSSGNLAGVATFTGRINYTTEKMDKANILEVLYG